MCCIAFERASINISGAYVRFCISSLVTAATTYMNLADGHTLFGTQVMHLYLRPSFLLLKLNWEKANILFLIINWFVTCTLDFPTNQGENMRNFCNCYFEKKNRHTFTSQWLIHSSKQTGRHHSGFSLVSRFFREEDFDIIATETNVFICIGNCRKSALLCGCRWSFLWKTCCFQFKHLSAEVLETIFASEKFADWLKSECSSIEIIYAIGLWFLFFSKISIYGYIRRFSWKKNFGRLRWFFSFLLIRCFGR